MNLPLKVLITGTNKGIGNQLTKAFIRLNPNAEIFATSRQKPEIAYQRWKHVDKDSRIKCKYLDVTSTQGINEFANEIQKEKVKIDVLINNAGVSSTEQLHAKFPNLQFSKQCLNINVLGAINLTQKILPFLSDTAKIVNLSSMYGGLKFQPEKAREKFSNPNITKQDIIDGIDQYLAEIESKSFVTFSPSAYGTSKMLLGAWSRFILQKQWLTGKQVSICVTPGLCLTSMTEDMAPQVIAKAHSAESGALRIHETIFYPDLDPNVFYHRGRRSNFITNGEELPWA